MATIRKRGAKWQVQIRRVGFRPLSRSFHIRKDAEVWVRLMEVQAERSELPSDRKALKQLTLAPAGHALDGFAQRHRHGLGTELAFGGVFVLPMTLTLHSLSS